MKILKLLKLFVIFQMITMLPVSGMEPDEIVPTYIQSQRYMETPEEHVNFLKSALLTAQEKIVIVSPYISCNALKRHGILEAISTSKHLCEIIIYTDANFDTDDHGKVKPNTMAGRESLVKAGVDLRIVDRIHTKNIIIDDQFITFGSFNWLSAVTDPSSNYARYETTVVLSGEEANGAITNLTEKLNSMKYKSHKEVAAFDSEAKFVEVTEKDIKKERKKLTEVGKIAIDTAVQLYRKYLNDPFFKERAYTIFVKQIAENRHSWAYAFSALKKVGFPQEEIDRLVHSMCFPEGDCSVGAFLDAAEVLRIDHPEIAEKVIRDLIKSYELTASLTASSPSPEDVRKRINSMGFVELAEEAYSAAQNSPY